MHHVADTRPMTTMSGVVESTRAALSIGLIIDFIGIGRLFIDRLSVKNNDNGCKCKSKSRK